MKIKRYIGYALIPACLAMTVSLTPVTVAAEANSPEISETSHKAHGAKHMKKRFKHIMKALDLTEEQKKQAREILQTQMKNMKNMKQDKDDSFKADYQALISAPSFDESKAKALAAKRSERMEQMFILKARISHDFYQILDETQKAKYLEIISTKKKGKHK